MLVKRRQVCRVTSPEQPSANFQRRVSKLVCFLIKEASSIPQPNGLEERMERRGGGGGRIVWSEPLDQQIAPARSATSRDARKNNLEFIVDDFSHHVRSCHRGGDSEAARDAEKITSCRKNECETWSSRTSPGLWTLIPAPGVRNRDDVRFAKIRKQDSPLARVRREIRREREQLRGCDLWRGHACVFKKEKLPISVAFLLEPNLFLDSSLSDSDSNEARDNLDETDRFNSRGSIYQTTDLYGYLARERNVRTQRWADSRVSSSKHRVYRSICRLAHAPFWSSLLPFSREDCTRCARSNPENSRENRSPRTRSRVTRASAKRDDRHRGRI